MEKIVFKSKLFFSSIICVIVGCYFIFSGYTKLVEIEILEYTLVSSFSINWFISPFLARFVIGIEFLLGIFLAFHLLLRTITVKAVLLLLLLFTVYVSYGALNPNSESCNCLGSFVQLSPLQSIAKNCFLIVAMLFVFFNCPSDFSFKKTKSYVVVLLFLSSFSIPFIINTIGYPVDPDSEEDGVAVLPFDQLYSSTDSIKIPTVDFRIGKHVVAFLSLTCKHCRLAGLKLATMYKQDPTLPIYFILNGDTSDLKSFHEFTRSANVPQSFLPAKYFIPLAGLSLPRIFYVEDGKKIFTSDYLTLTDIEIKNWLVK